MGPIGPRHPIVQRLRRLSGRRSARAAEGVFVAEGPSVVAEALSSSATVETVIVESTHAADGRWAGLAARAGARFLTAEEGVIARAADTVHPQGVLAVVRRLDVPLDTVTTRSNAERLPVVVCVDVRDPGNLGTIIRAAEAAGCAGVVCAGTTVDVYNSKVVRSSAGSVFHVPVVAGDDVTDSLTVVGRLQDSGVKCLATSSHTGQAGDGLDLTVPVAFVLGNEAAGLDDTLIARCAGAITIPLAGRAESLNVSMATAVLVFEAARQRRGDRT